jgi:Tol biopolymer transport system component
METNTLIPLVNKMGYSILSWSPDSQWLAFNHDYKQSLFVASMNALVPVELVASNNFSFASWSPDGQWLAFTTDSGTGSLNLWNPTTQSIELLFEGNGRLSQPIWSPDSHLLAASLNAEDESYLFVSDVNNKSTNSILTGPPPELGPTWWPLTVLNWSPNGQWILFQVLRKDKRSLSIIDPANGQSFTVLDFTEMTIPNNVYWLP